MAKNIFYKIAAGSLVVGVLGIASLSFTQYSSAAPVSTATQKPTLDLTCLQNASERRDNSIIAVFDGYHGTIKTALETRRDGLKTAFGLTDKKERQAAIRNAWNTYKTTQRKAKTTLKDIRNAAWQKFNVDRKTCGSAASAEDKTPSGVDAEL